MGDFTNWITKGSAIKYLGKSYVDDKENGIPFIHIANLKNNILSTENINYIDRETHENELKRSKIFPGDIVLSIAGTIGFYAIIPDIITEANTNQDLAIIRINSDDLIIQFLYYYLGTDLAQKLIENEITGGTRKHYNVTKVSKLKILIPPRLEQEKILSILIGTDLSLSNLRSDLTQLKQLKKGFMQQLLTGKIRVRV